MLAAPVSACVLLPTASRRKNFLCAACEDPTPLEIVDCCNRGLKLQAELEVRLLAWLPNGADACPAGLAAPGASAWPYRWLT